MSDNTTSIAYATEWALTALLFEDLTGKYHLLLAIKRVHRYSIEVQVMLNYWKYQWKSWIVSNSWLDLDGDQRLS